MTSATDEKYWVHKRGARELRLAGSTEGSWCGDVGQRGQVSSIKEQLVQRLCGREEHSSFQTCKIRAAGTQRVRELGGGRPSWRVGRGHI